MLRNIFQRADSLSARKSISSEQEMISGTLKTISERGKQFKCTKFYFKWGGIYFKWAGIYFKCADIVRIVVIVIDKWDKLKVFYLSPINLIGSPLTKNNHNQTTTTFLVHK